MSGNYQTMLYTLQILKSFIIISTWQRFLFATCGTLPNPGSRFWELLPSVIAEVKQKQILGQFFYFSDYLGDKYNSILKNMCPMEEVGANCKIFSVDDTHTI